MTVRPEFASSLSSRLLRMSPLQRRLLLVAADALVLPLSVWLSFWLRLANPFHPSFIASGWWLLPAVWLVGLPLYAISGQYKGLTRYVGSRAIYQLSVRNALLVVMLVGCSWLLSLPMPPRSSWVLIWMLLTVFTGAVRFICRDLLLGLRVKLGSRYTRLSLWSGSAECSFQ